MSYPPQKISLKSEGVGTLLVAFLWLNIAVEILRLLYYLLPAVAPGGYTSSELFETLNDINTISLLPVGAITVILFLVWMYLLHRDMKALFRTYPITPGAAMAQLMIPFYNLWGIWNVFSAMEERLRTRGGADLKFWLPLMYVTGFASQVLDRFRMAESRINEASGSSTNSPTLMLVALGVAIFLTIIWLMMTGVIRKSVDHRAKEIEDEKAMAASPAQ